mgnify:CR=1 FL=1
MGTTASGHHAGQEESSGSDSQSDKKKKDKQRNRHLDLVRQQEVSREMTQRTPMMVKEGAMMALCWDELQTRNREERQTNLQVRGREE